jgi:DNA-binding transcriptional ArsR family regulator
MVPENELGVIVIFVQQAKQAGFEIISINSKFPDAVIAKGGVEYRTEFEFRASNFRQHSHDVRKCDLIICWENDISETVLPVLALNNPEWIETPIKLPTEAERNLEYWKRRALSAEAKLQTRQAKSISDDGVIDLGYAAKTFALYVENPKLPQAEAAKMLDVSERTIRNHLVRLEETGLLRRGVNGIEVLLRQNNS